MKTTIKVPNEWDKGDEITMTPQPATHTQIPWPEVIRGTSYLDEQPSWIIPGVAHFGDEELSKENAELSRRAVNRDHVFEELVLALRVIRSMLKDIDDGHHDLRSIDSVAANALAKT